MIEKIKGINNPLTLKAIFAGIVETVATCVIPFVSKEVQQDLIWFVVTFPILLVLLFFTILFFKPKNLYSPSDFKDERNFLKTMGLLDSQVRGKRTKEKNSLEN